MGADPTIRLRRESKLGVGPVKSENVAADEKESVPSEPEFCLEAGSVGNVAQFITHNCEANLFVQCTGWADGAH
ncbi:hypothetical protein Tco_0174017 [Tanacetum coccineum]